jgi:5'-3' exonuclease
MKKMGVKDLMSIIRSKCPAVLKKGAPFAPINRVWVDTPLIVVASCKIAESEGHDPFLLVEQSLRKTSNQILALDCKEVRWIFDGRGRPEKKRTIIGRSQNHQAYSKKCEKKAEERLLLLDDLSLAESVYASFLPVRRVTIRDITNYAMQLLKTFPSSSVEIAKHDSEEHIARMMEGDDIALTNDSDAIVFGCSTIAQNFGAPNETWLELKDVLEGLGMTMHELRTLAVFLGNDFNARIPKRGAVAAFKAVQDGKTIEQYADSEAWRAEADAAYRVFAGIKL